MVDRNVIVNDNDLKNMIDFIDLALRRGAVDGKELSTVALLREKLVMARVQLAEIMRLQDERKLERNKAKK